MQKQSQNILRLRGVEFSYQIGEIGARSGRLGRAESLAGVLVNPGLLYTHTAWKEKEEIPVAF